MVYAVGTPNGLTRTVTRGDNFQHQPLLQLSEEVWAGLEPALQKVRNQQGSKERQGDRDFLSAIAYLLKEECTSPEKSDTEIW